MISYFLSFSVGEPSGNLCTGSFREIALIVFIFPFSKVPADVKWSTMSPYEAVSFCLTDVPLDLDITGVGRSSGDLRVRFRIYIHLVTIGPLFSGMAIFTDILISVRWHYMNLKSLMHIFPDQMHGTISEIRRNVEGGRLLQFILL